MNLGRLSFPSNEVFQVVFGGASLETWYPGIPVSGIPSHLTLLCGTRCAEAFDIMTIVSFFAGVEGQQIFRFASVVS